MDRQTRPEAMNASPHHSKVKVTLTMGNTLYVAGGYVSGKMEMECRADKGLGIGTMMVELTAVQELTSRDHSATSTFLRSRRLFQGPGLPPSNAVQAHPLPGDPPLPPHYHQARRGLTTFLFRIPLPSSSPASISFGSGIARVKYEAKASVQVAWKGEKTLVIDKKELDVVESFEQDFGRSEPEGVVVGENGKIFVQGRVVGGVLIAGESGCVELQVKNHSSKKNTGLTITLSRHLLLLGAAPGEKPPLQLSDTLAVIPYRGQEYIIPPGAEGVASLVFDVPKSAKSVKGGSREDDDGRTSEALFEIRCIVGVKLNMGLGSKDINLDIPVTVAHSAALPALTDPTPYPYTYTPVDQLPLAASNVPPRVPYVDPYGYPVQLPMSPPIPAYMDQGHVWLPPLAPPASYNQAYPHYPSPFYPVAGSAMPPYMAASPAPLNVPYVIPTRPSSAGARMASQAVPSGLPVTSNQNPVLHPLDNSAEHYAGPEEGKGERASRITQHLRLSSRNRSVSPTSHRFPLPPSAIVENIIPEVAPISVPNPQPQPEIHTIRTLANLPPPPANETHAPSLSPPEVSKVVYSPRPLLSPKHSFSIDPITKNSVSRSERVEALEKMAEAVNEETRDLSSDIPKPPTADQASHDGPSSDTTNVVDKTLPTPPARSVKKTSFFSPLSASRPPVDQLFVASASDTLSPPDPVPSEQTPPTPTLTAVHPTARPKSNQNLLSLSGPRESESGLDALERRLLAAVGTRKIESNARPDVRTVLPIAIPPPNTKAEPLNDSAISSLTLADHGGELGGDLGLDPDDWDDRTHKAAKSSLSGDDRDRDRDGDASASREPEGGAQGRGSGASKGKSDSGRTKDVGNGKKKVRNTESNKRKAAKGRVAAWLGAIEPTAPPEPSPAESTPVDGDQDSGPFDDGDVLVKQDVAPPPAAPPATKEGAERNAQESQLPDDVSSAPNPRSSGFVPIGTFKRDTFRRYATGRGGPVVNPAAEEAEGIANLWSSKGDDILMSKPFALRTHPPMGMQSIRTDKGVSPPSASSVKDGVTVKHRLRFNAHDPSHPDWPRVASSNLAHGLPVYPPQPLDPEVKYDIRSARGGRGGKVTAVAAIWAAGAFKKADSPPPDKLVVAPKPKKVVPPPFVTKKPTSRAPPPISSKPPLLLAASRKKSPSSAASSDGSTAAARTDSTVDNKTQHVTKSSSAPALVSSSLAIPMLSSTASLARPVTKAKTPIKPPPTLFETSTPRVSAPHQGLPARTPSGTKTDLAFGQARLRDLIRKYQGQST
ncbi:hypothetical protein EYR36_001709 [Pleurotus pulmonarius]|nr:hypothetical protein EYR36_008348 [Pleurotus pulmonarius]KAF4579889.1 hypothetical protein EYR36_001709 [Pleurotus pulmonarius]